VDNVLPQYMYDNFHLDLHIAGLLAAIFGECSCWGLAGKSYCIQSRHFSTSLASWQQSLVRPPAVAQHLPRQASVPAALLWRCTCCC
jgi:hypothetical protein